MKTDRIVLAALIGLVAALPAVPQTASELLQKGIYTQETAGDLDSAIAIYRQIVNSGNSPRDIAAQAQYRLAQSLLEKGDLANGATEFSNLARNYADYGKLISSLAAQARANVPYSPVEGDLAQLLADSVRKEEMRLREIESFRNSKGTVQPDKTLIDQAMSEIAGGDYDRARLTLNTFINSYPDSVYVPRAKLAIVDSWLRQGGARAIAQAQAEYNDFVRFYAAPGAGGGRGAGAGAGRGPADDTQIAQAAAQLRVVQARMEAIAASNRRSEVASMIFDPNSPVTVTGSVLKQVMTTPSGSLSVDKYTFLTASPIELARQGFTKNDLRLGYQVTITGVLAAGGRTLSDGTLAARADTITTADGRKIFDRAAIK